ncbi:hypothetical protein H1R20_g4387, partial [Candolleomyces eurysporus]
MVHVFLLLKEVSFTDICTASAASTPDIQNEGSAVFDTAYDIVLYSAAELQKPKVQHESKGRQLIASSNLNWQDFWAQVKIRVVDALFPDSTVILDESFTLFFTIPHVIKNENLLCNENDYEYLLTKLKDIKEPAGGRK